MTGPFSACTPIMPAFPPATRIAFMIYELARLSLLDERDGHFAFEVVRQRGGTPSPAVTKRTKLLIVGELGWPLLDDGRPSNE
jgi:hypothetical protein